MAVLNERVSAEGLLCPAGVLASTPAARLRTGQERAGHLRTRDLTPWSQGTFRRSEPVPLPPSLFFFFFWSQKEGTGKKTLLRFWGQNRPCRKLRVSGEPRFQQAPFQAALESLYVVKKKKKKTTTQLALVWFSAKPCLFKFALGALGGSQLLIEHTWSFWNWSYALPTISCPVFFPLRREILESGEKKNGPATGVLSLGMQGPLWGPDSFPAPPHLKDFLGK